MKQGFWNNFIRRIAACAMALVALFSMSSCSLANVFAWMTDNGLSSPIDITSNVHKTYFESGDGSKGSPYVIAKPLQLYYFAWLQNLGLFNVDSDDEGTALDTVYFVLKNDIDMTGYQLPSVGTTQYPFLGNFDGNGKKISNLTVENERDHLFEPPTGSEELEKYAEIIGFFGVVGALPNDNSYSYESTTNEIKNLLIENIIIATHTEKALAGFVAGYANGIIDCVGVVGGTIKMVNTPNPTTYTGNISDYALIGYCTPTCKNEVYVIGTSISAPNSTATYQVVLNNSNDGEGQGWGGSVKMSDIYTWLSAIKNRNDITNDAYILERIDCVVDLGNKVTFTLDTDDAVARKTQTIDGFGSFVFDSNTYANYVNFVSGGQKVTEYVYTYSNELAEVYYIKDGDYYLNFDGNEITSQGNPTPWYRGIGDFDGAIYTILNNRVYYLTIDGGRITTILDKNADVESLPEWDFAENQLTLNGVSIECDEGTWQVATSTGSYKISINYNGTTYYLDNNGTTAIQREANVNNAAVWTIETVDGGCTLSTVIDDTTYYLGYNANTERDLALSMTATIWQRDGDRIYVVRNNQNYYLRYSSGGGNFVCQNYSSTYVDLTFTAVAGNSTSDSANIEMETVTNSDKKKVVYEAREYIDTSLTNGYYDASGTWTTTGSKDNNIDRTAGITYFPLSSRVSGTNYQINANNTGYIVGAEWDTTTFDNQDGSASNLRISSYTSNVPNQTAAKNPYTISYKTKGDDGKYQFVQTFDPNDIPEIDSNNNVNFSDAHLKKIAGFGLQKFTGCYGNYLGSVSDNSWEGLHFMNAPISTDNLTTITASLSSSKEPIDNYQVPTNCIDFNLYDRGFINVVAGSYYTQSGGNDSFFSIYQIERYEDGKRIKSIKEISKIYAKMSGGEIDTSEKYHYTYVGENSTIPAGYEMVFDCQWITNSNSYTGWANSRAYYFEVPVNAGEYAIGSTQGRTGAYLVYLDLAANAQILDRVKDYEKIIENQTVASIPKGVEILSEKEAALFNPTSDPKPVDPFNSAFVSVNTGSTGTVTVEKTDDTIKVTTDSGGNVTAEYISVNTVLTDKTGGSMSIPITQTTTIERVTYRDKNKTTGDLTVTVLTKTTLQTKSANGTVTGTETTYTKEITVTDKNGNLVGTPTSEPITDLKQFVPGTIDPNGVATAEPGDKLIDLAFAYGQSVDLQISYLYIPATETTDATYLITIINPGDEDVSIKAILTEAGVNSGLVFIITDGTNETTLNATQDAQKVTIAGQTAVEAPTDEPTDEPIDEPTE